MGLLCHTKMSSSLEAASMDRLPPDVLSNKIFIRLPAKLLAQMRCVSKPWNDLLTRPSFIKSHLDYSKHNNEEIILVFYNYFSFDNSQPFTAHPTRYPNQELRSLIKIPVMEPSSIFNLCGGRCCNIIGSVNGLICFFKGSDPPHNIYIWNPSLSVVLTLPPFVMPSPDTNEPFNIFYRFGFDPQTDDYKVVKLISRLKPPPDFNDSPIYSLFGNFTYVVKEWLPVEVYSMRKGSWEPVAQKVPSHLGRIRYDDVEVCGDGHDGHVHWLCKPAEMGNQKAILAYDMGLETFSEIALPADNNGNFYVLGILGGKLCVMFYVTNGDSEVWILDKYGVAESWVKHHQFSQFRDIDLFGFTLHNEFIFAVDNRLAFYDPIEEKVKLSNILARLVGGTKIVQYVDSLVWIVPSEAEINCCSISSLQI